MQQTEQDRHGDDRIATADKLERFEVTLLGVHRCVTCARRIAGELLKISASVGAFSATVAISEPAAAIEEVIHLLG